MRLALFLFATVLGAAEFRAGVARRDITPDGQAVLAGYADRVQPSTGVGTRLYVKALALADAKVGRAVIVTADLLGLTRAITDVAAARAGQQFGLERAQLLFSATHTHSAPMLRGKIAEMAGLTTDQNAAVNRYTQQVTDALVQVIGDALASVQPATLRAGSGEVGFAVNRRLDVPGGPVDHRVPVLRVSGADGKMIALLFGYACHNAALPWANREVSGDYAAYAEAALEEAHAGAMALFVTLCAGDQNPVTRGSLELARDHGKALAGAVEQALRGRLQELRSPIRTAFRQTELAFAPDTRETFSALPPNASVYERRRAEAMLAQYAAGHPPRTLTCPVQGVRFGKELTLLALGGEPVVDYGLRVAREYAGERVWTLGYANDVATYVPSRRVLREGSYEAVDSMMYYGLPGPFTEDVEERVFAAVGQVLRRVGVK